MHLPVSNQRLALAVATLLARASGTTVLLLLPGRLVLDVGVGPVPCVALAGAAAGILALATPVGRYLTFRMPGRLTIVGTAWFAAVAAVVVLASSTGPAAVVAAFVLGLAAIGTARPAWESLVVVSGATGSVRRGARAGHAVGLVVALVTSVRPAGPEPGIRIGACLGLLGLLVVLVWVRDSRAPLPPRRSATAARCRRASTLAPVRSTAALGAAVTALIVAGTAALAAFLGPATHPSAVAGSVGAGWLCAWGFVQVLGTRACAVVSDELRDSVRAVTETSALLGGTSAALLICLGARFLG